MMKYKALVIIIFTTYTASAQSSFEFLLSTIEHNNLSLKANTEYLHTRNLEYRTGVTPYDPEVAFDYMYGSPVGAGNQRDFTVTQRFDFPTAYVKKRTLANTQVQRSDWQMEVYRKDVLLNTQKIALELVYENKRKLILAKRFKDINALVEGSKKKLDSGDATILDVNKAKLQLLSIQSEVEQNNIRIETLLLQLKMLNGGQLVEFKDTTYPATPIIPDYEILFEEIEKVDPYLKVLSYNQQVSTQSIQLQKALSLPKPQVGYHSQGILGQSYKGFHIGTSIPLWENKNKVKAEKANLTFSQMQLAQYKNEHSVEIEQLYNKYQRAHALFDEYSDIINTIKSDYLLARSLALGQINTLEYFLELSYYNSAYDKYLEVEYNYHKTMAELLKHRL